MKNALLAIFLFGGSILFLLFIGQNVGPTSPLFPVQRLDESLLYITKRTPEAKVAYYQYLIQKRFYDIANVVKLQHEDLLVAVSLRYSTTVGKAVQISSTNNVHTSQLKKELEQQKKSLENIVAHYTSIDKRQKYIQDAINYIDIYERKL